MLDFPSYERIEKAISLRKPDRVPAVPLIDIFAARYGGITQHEMLFDIKKADGAIQKTMDDLGPFDGQHLSYAGMGPILTATFPVPPKLSGVGDIPDDAIWQFDERSIMTPEDYQLLARRPLRWLTGKMRDNNPIMANPWSAMTGMAQFGLAGLKIANSVRTWRRKGLESMVGVNITFTPMEFISIALRSFTDFVLDIYRHPDDIKAASRSLMGPMKALALLTVNLTRVKRVFMGGTRTSASAISPKQFEEFALPEWEEMVHFLLRHNITPILHLDSDWTPFFHYFRDLPAGRCVLNLDGTSDIFKAKEVLGDRMCIMGDVPAALLKLGEPEEVDAYCERLIKEVGADGGFILSSGCTVPIDSKPENVKAMLQSIKRYGTYSK
ncbi:MAG: uroporphyrinogen decarboxylase family protein [Candidatus Geothermincolia bacterium]